MSELLPCPFCGATPDVDNRGSFTLEDQPKWAGVICCINGPEIRTGYEKWPAWRQAAIDAWNTRTPTPPGPADGGEAVERVALAILERRIKPDFHEVRDGAWTVDHDKELAIAAIAALRPQAADNGGADEAYRTACRLLDNIAPGLEKSSKTEWVINQIDNAIVGIHENYKAIITALRRDIENMAAASLRPQAALPGEAVRAEKLLHQITNLLWSAAPIRLDDKQAAIDLITAALRAPSADMMCVERGVCEEIKQIMQTYREQEAERGYVDTPGGLEHMGDVWRLLSEWDDKLRAAARGDAAQIDENATDDRDADLPTAEDVRGILAPGDAAQKAEPEWIDKFTDEIT